MKAVTVKQLRTALEDATHQELITLCLRLSKFKKENKELLTYLLFEAFDEEGYIIAVKEEIDEQFESVNTKTWYFTKKSVRKILRIVKKYIRYSQNKETEVELLLYFCEKLKAFRPNIKNNKVLTTIFERELTAAKKKSLLLYEDLQYDFEMMIAELVSL